MQKFYNVTRQEMEGFLLPLGFKPVTIQGTVELTYAKIVRHEGHELSLRVYSAIWPTGESRDRGSDAIRVQLWWMYEGEPRMVGKSITVKRIGTWQSNLRKALDRYTDNFKTCPACGSPMVLRNGPRGEFWGCATWKWTKCSGKAGQRQVAPLDPSRTVAAPQVAEVEEVRYVIVGDDAPAKKPSSLWDRLMAPSEPVKPVAKPTAKPEPAPVEPNLRLPVRTPKPVPQSRPAPVGSPMDRFRIPADKISGPQKDAEVAFVDQTENLLLVSRAGGGKTTLLKHLASFRREKQRAVYLAFNRKNATEGRKKLPREIPSMTTHSFLKRVLTDNQVKLPEEVTENKNWIVMDEVYPAMNNRDRKRIRKAAFKLIGLAKNFACRPGDLDAIRKVMDDYVFELQNEQEVTTVVEVVDEVLRLSVPGAKYGVMYDFDDMIWWPMVLDLPMPHLSFVLLDEVQDFNACQMEMVQRLIKRRTRIVAVGDPFQAVYRFRGADSDAFDKLREILKASERGVNEILLPTSYRNSKAIIRYVVENTVVKDIQAAPDAPEGDVRTDLSYDEVLDILTSDFGQRMAV